MTVLAVLALIALVIAGYITLDFACEKIARALRKAMRP